MRYQLVRCLSLLSLLIGMASTSWATTYTFTQIDIPGAAFTSAFGINDAGQIVGSFLDATGEHAFLDTAGTFLQINFPGVLFSTGAFGINDAGQIVGRFSASPGGSPH